FGLNTSSMQPGLGFIYGYQPSLSYVEALANQNLLSRDPLFNSMFQQQYSQTLNLAATLEPAQDFRVDLTWTKSFNKSYNELFKDTGRGSFDHLNPYATGAFNISYVGLSTMFGNSGPGE